MISRMPNLIISRELPLSCSGLILNNPPHTGRLSIAHSDDGLRSPTMASGTLPLPTQTLKLYPRRIIALLTTAR